ncbi:MAG TPA: hypothetical protein VK737_09845 [Opitutales bacterium]|jgi:hypothetical protein|nr:hypothetical protein [Opitutales bacterium]
MTTPIWIGLAGCPSATVSAELNIGVPFLVGFMEFDSLTVPPNVYRNYQTSGGGWTWKRTSPGHPNWTIQGVDAGVATYGFDVTTGSVSSGNDSTITDTNDSNVTHSGVTSSTCVAYNGSLLYYGVGATTPSADGLNGTSINDPMVPTAIFGTGAEFQVGVTVNSQTSLTLTQTAQSASNGVGGTDSVTAGALTFELINQDLESDAITRFLAGATPSAAGPYGPTIADIFSNGIFGLQEDRAATAGLVQFGYQNGTYQLNVSNIIPGISYHYVVVWESRDAIGDGTGDTSGYGSTWTNSDAQSGDFTPTGITFNVMGLAIPIHAGKQTRIKSLAITPN